VERPMPIPGNKQRKEGSSGHNSKSNSSIGAPTRRKDVKYNQSQSQ